MYALAMQKFIATTVVVALLATLVSGVRQPAIAASTTPARTSPNTDSSTGPVQVAQPNACAVASKDLGGNVYRDRNFNGKLDSGLDAVVSAVTVYAYTTITNTTITNTNVTSTSVAADGTYVFPAIFNANQAVRLEFRNLPAGLKPGLHGENSGTTVQFFNTASCAADLALNSPSDFCQANPELVSVVLRPGDPLAPNATTATTNTVFSVPYSGTVASGLCTAGQSGAVWGLAYQRESKRLFASAVMAAGAGFGTLGSGGIYSVSATALNSGAAFIDLDTLGFATRPANFPATNAARGLTTVVTRGISNTVQQIVFDNQRAAVGKVGIGDIDISPDGTTLWAVNLFSRSLMRIILPANGSKPVAANIISIQIPAPQDGGASICVRDEYRPWGIKVTESKLYVGVTCSDEGRTGAEPGQDANTDLRAVILVHDLTNNSWAPLTITNNNQTGPSFQLKGYRWDKPNPSNDAYNPQPFIADLEIDVDGSFILGIGDRWPMVGSDTLGLVQPWSRGDILRVCNVSGALTVEANGTCSNGGGLGENQNTATEYYDDRPGDNAGFDSGHPENQTGGLALFPIGQAKVASVAYNPAAPYGAGDRGGFQVYDNDTGLKDWGFETVRAVNDYAYGKAGGLGDIEIICNAAPVEIGNRVWRDNDNDGVQDPNDPAIAGVTVVLYNVSGTAIATATTNALGQYYFIDANDPRAASLTGAHIGKVATAAGGLAVNTQYQVRVLLAQPALAGLEATTPNYQTGADADLNDSDGDSTLVAGNSSTALFAVGGAGDNNHTFDFGFRAIAPTSLGDSDEPTLDKRVFLPMIRGQ